MILRRRVRSLVLGVALASQALTVVPVHADAVPWGSVLIPGSQWAGGFSTLGDLNVYSNGDGKEDQITTYGLSFECVELAQRWSALRYGEQAVWPVSIARQMWDVAPNLKVPFVQLPNGGQMGPQLGDLIIFDVTPTNTTGHVAVVSGVEPGYVNIVEQNWANSSPTGTAHLPINGTTMPPRDGLPIVGWLRASNAATLPPSVQRLGYWMATGDGKVFNFGNVVPFDGTSSPPSTPVVGIAHTPTGQGYWLAASGGGVYAYGDAPFAGSAGATVLTHPIVGISSTATGKGYWLVASDGGVFSYGDARYFGSMGAIKLQKPVVGIVPTPTGNGYWLVASDGGIFAFGDARYFGSAGNIKLQKPVVGMAAIPDGQGYWLVASDGGVFAFGSLGYFGSTGNIPLTKPIVGLASTGDGLGYRMVASDGGVFCYGDAQFYGSLSGQSLPQPVVGLSDLG